MAKGRSILLVKVLEPEPLSEGAADGSPVPQIPSPVLNTVSLGSFREIVSLLAQFNTAPDGSALTPGVLYGPGVIVQLPMVDAGDPVLQLLVSINEEATAWPVLTRVCSVLGWKMLDPSSGRTFG